MKSVIKSIIALTPYTVRKRNSLNRFQAIGESLTSLRNRGFKPDLIIDGGANTGDFSKEMLLMFPKSVVCAIEPQPGCQTDLAALAKIYPDRFYFHALALCASDSEVGNLKMSTNVSERSTGAHVVLNPTEGHTVTVSCTTLDAATEEMRIDTNSCMLKLDLQGYELEALKGSTATLENCDAVLTEVSFYAQAYEPRISELVSFLARHGFELYDISSIFARPRDDRPRQGDFLFIKSGSLIAKDTAWA